MFESLSSILFRPAKGLARPLDSLVAEDEWGDPRTRPREFGKLLREEATEGGAEDVNFLQGQLREKLLESSAPLLNAPVGGGVDSDHTDTARRQSQALKVSLWKIATFKTNFVVCFLQDFFRSQGELSKHIDLSSWMEVLNCKNMFKLIC